MPTTDYQVHHTPDGIGRCWPEEEGSRCPQYDGKRCGIQGQRPSIGDTCPVWAADLVQAARAELVFPGAHVPPLRALVYATGPTDEPANCGTDCKARIQCAATGRCLERHPLADWER